MSINPFWRCSCMAARRFWCCRHIGLDILTLLPLQACNRMSLYCVPLYDSLGENAIEFIINHSESTIVFAASDKLANLGAALPHVLKLVKTVVYWGDGDASTVAVSIVPRTLTKSSAIILLIQSALLRSMRHSFSFHLQSVSS